ncbi:uncharacterized protein LOC134183420 isoform X2 [Corticium candelabrum]|uniref:uncharacterized protein LOC134183420 isoform X2 n=1 Tax=Corticium candelabrum TaxID=121492 RepID=UPI002E25292A|nr:uncharacterized protein LOC134183420 isoform X2 [Corticium candelabrum]
MWRCLLNAAKQRFNSTHLREVGKQQLRNVGERADFVQSADRDQTTTADHDSGHPTSDITNNPTTLKATECLSTVEEDHEQVELLSPVVCSSFSGSATLSNGNSLTLSKGSVLANLEEKEHVEYLVRSSVKSDHENDLNDDHTTKVHNTQAVQESHVMKAKFQENQHSDDLKDSHSMLGKRDVKVPVDLHVRKPHQPMISTQFFDIGDLALFCYSEDVEMYVALSTSCEKQFLHPESQEKLQPSTANTSKGSDPIIMAITNREFCNITKG